VRDGVSPGEFNGYEYWVLQGAELRQRDVPSFVIRGLFG